jgi:hypothetical protein
MFPHNRASYAFKCIEKEAPLKDVTLEQIDQWHDQVQKMCADQHYSHFYDAAFCLNAAKVAHRLEKTDKCNVLIKKALEICGNNPSNTKDTQEAITKFCKEKSIKIS